MTAVSSEGNTKRIRVDNLITTCQTFLSYFTIAVEFVGLKIILAKMRPEIGTMNFYGGGINTFMCSKRGNYAKKEYNNM